MLPQHTLQQAIALYQDGKPSEARALLVQLVRQEPDNEKAWLWLAACTDLSGEKRHCLEQVVRINPGNAEARRALNAFGYQPQPPVSAPLPRPQAAYAPPPPPRYAPAPAAPQTDNSWWNRISPDWKSALIFVAVRLLVASFNYATGWGFLLSFPVSMLVAFSQGALVARFAKQSGRYAIRDYPGLGAKSGLWAYLIGLLLGLAVYVLTSGITMGVALIMFPLIIIGSLGDVLIMVAANALGAWLYGKYGGGQIFLYTCLSSCGCSVAFGLLLAAVIALLWGFLSQIMQPLIQSLPF